MENTLGSIALICGNDTYLKRKVLNDLVLKFKKAMGSDSLNTIELEAPTFDELMEEIYLPSFLNDGKVIIVYDSGFFKGNRKNDSGYDSFKKFLEDEKEVEYVLSDLLLCFVETDIDAKNTLYKLIYDNYKNEKNKTKRLYNIFRCNMLDDSARVKMLLDLAKRDNVMLQIAEANYLSKIVEDKTYTLINEYNKLANLDKAKNGKKITIDDINSTCIVTDDVMMYEITNELERGNKEKAFKLIDEIGMKKEYERGNLLLGYIYKYIRNIYLAGMSVREDTKNNLDKMLNLSPRQGFLKNKYIRLAKKNSIPRLEYILGELRDIDRDSKLYNIDVITRIKEVLNILV